MITMATAHCYKGYCEPILEKKEVAIAEECILAGGLILATVSLLALKFYVLTIPYFS
jgi:hypothetical protein